MYIGDNEDSIESYSTLLGYNKYFNNYLKSFVIHVDMFLQCEGFGCCQFPWSNEINCQINECGANNKCLVATKSITGPNQANQITSTSKDQLFQCRSKSNPPGKAFYIFVINYTTYINFFFF